MGGNRDDIGADGFRRIFAGPDDAPYSESFEDAYWEQRGDERGKKVQR